ncbi:tetratricopeptide repeat protein [Treponema phagedenis]|uniref:Tetratricopeptide repeat protein n=1 Tax=Treponema phagedenis TaxID=162 RepID=A0A0B7GZQ9_TREPH|nr:tetratricopeptide repeat protein [Treponema phagedenis]NVP24500.1 tetratricopeptide repeat protein [Treponema phagedenis]QEJ95518.1 tetratricopeptide repeat protein [Treponema phagedenis]QEJ97740.1 tetratricopeptide repeat protein [Treponema phagedenis]QEK01372.1 tetratricopeptide repeat protein [Treponema phagedenis]QEK03307.1 tetratricopeptide repeat protein [Treponema phagedenis]
MKETADYLNDFAVTLAAEGLHAEAIACLRKGLRMEPHNSLMWFNLGLSYYALKKKTDCTSALYQAARCDPFDADIWDTLGVILHETGEIEAAQKAYMRALNLESDSGRIWNNYGTLLFNKKEYTEALRSFETAVSLMPDLGDAVFNLRDTYLVLKNDEKAAICTKLLEQMNYPDEEKE